MWSHSILPTSIHEPGKNCNKNVASWTLLLNPDPASISSGEEIPTVGNVVQDDIVANHFFSLADAHIGRLTMKVRPFSQPNKASFSVKKLSIANNRADKKDGWSHADRNPSRDCFVLVPCVMAAPRRHPMR